jgi:1,2-diacylglycerol 3-alpha-glucosyltransferase
MVLMKLAVCFTNFGPYHLARLRALAAQLRHSSSRLIAYEVAGAEYKYPWRQNRSEEPFQWTTLFSGQVLERILPGDCRAAIVQALERDQPDAIGVVGYVRPEALAAAWWARRRRLPAILMSESQAIDRPRVWWKELIKLHRLRLFDAALVGGPTHRDYLVQLGMPASRIALGYNSVDNDFFTSSARASRQDPTTRSDMPSAPYFLAVCRFVPEKNLIRLIEAFARYYAQCSDKIPWHLVICGDGPIRSQISQVIDRSGCAGVIHRPGFLQVNALPPWYAHASAFILPSLSEPWGLVANEAAACELPLLVSEHAGCAGTLVPDPEGTTGARFDPLDISAMTKKLHWIASLSDEQRRAMGMCARAVVSRWGPDRFAQGALAALDLARPSARCHGRRRSTFVKAR